MIFKSSSFAQNIGLDVGDNIPDFEISNIINYKTKKTTSSSLINKNQLLIIDFWSTSCGTCIEFFPVVNKLEKQFGNRLKVLPVTYENEDYVKKFLMSNKYTRSLTITSVVSDTIFTKYFRHESMPHEVWIYDGKVIAITSNEYVDSNNVQKVLAGNKVNWPVKNDFYKFDRKTRLFSLNLPDSANLLTTNVPLVYSAISGYRLKVNSEGMTGGSGIIRDSKDNTIRSYFLNQPILNSYLSIYAKLVKRGDLIKPSNFFFKNQVIWNVKDKKVYTWEKSFGYSTEWLRQYGICFESVEIDRGQSDSVVYNSLLHRLNSLLGLDVHWEKRLEKTYTIVKIADVKHVEKIDDPGIVIHLGGIVDYFNDCDENPYLFNAVVENPRLILNIKSWTDIEGLEKSLRSYGYHLKSDIKSIDKLVFSVTHNR